MCMKWGNVTAGRFPHELPNFPELAGAHNYCRYFVLIYQY